MVNPIKPNTQLIEKVLPFRNGEAVNVRVIKNLNKGGIDEFNFAMVKKTKDGEKLVPACGIKFSTSASKNDTIKRFEDKLFQLTSEVVDGFRRCKEIMDEVLK